jgi:citrate lyase subunit beta/citryl-CoA lyase
MTAAIRSLLFVPGDSERKLEKSRESNADAVVLDLEDAVAASRRSIAREMVCAYLKQGRSKPGTAAWVRINPITSRDALLDLAAVVAGRPAGLLVPKADGPTDVLRVSHGLDVLEAREGLPIGSIKIIPVATETARAPFTLGEYRNAGLERLYGITWGAEDLSADIGAAAKTDEDGTLSLTYRTVRSLTLLAAKASGVEAIETVYPDFKDSEGLKRSSFAARREGFTARLAIHPDQVEIINAAFSPSVEEVAFAERVVAAFAATPDAGVCAVDGKMLDRPHLIQAEKLLARRDAFASRATSAPGGSAGARSIS